MTARTASHRRLPTATAMPTDRPGKRRRQASPVLSGSASVRRKPKQSETTSSSQATRRSQRVIRTRKNTTPLRESRAESRRTLYRSPTPEVRVAVEVEAEPENASESEEVVAGLETPRGEGSAKKRSQDGREDAVEEMEADNGEDASIAGRVRMRRRNRPVIAREYSEDRWADDSDEYEEDRNASEESEDEELEQRPKSTKRTRNPKPPLPTPEKSPITRPPVSKKRPAPQPPRRRPTQPSKRTKCSAYTFEGDDEDDPEEPIHFPPIIKQEPGVGRTTSATSLKPPAVAEPRRSYGGPAALPTPWRTTNNEGRLERGGAGALTGRPAAHGMGAVGGGYAMQSRAAAPGVASMADGGPRARSRALAALEVDGSGVLRTGAPFMITVKTVINGQEFEGTAELKLRR